MELLIVIVFIYLIASGKSSKKHNTSLDRYCLHKAGIRLIKRYDPGNNDSSIHSDEDWEDDSVGRKGFGSQLN